MPYLSHILFLFIRDLFLDYLVSPQEFILGFYYLLFKLLFFLLHQSIPPFLLLFLILLVIVVCIVSFFFQIFLLLVISVVCLLEFSLSMVIWIFYFLQLVRFPLPSFVRSFNFSFFSYVKMFAFPKNHNTKSILKVKVSHQSSPNTANSY